MSQEFIDRLKSQFAGPLDPKDKYLLGEMRSVIDFALEHDLRVDLVACVIGHDLGEFSRQGGFKNFSPKSVGFSGLVS